MLTVPDMDLPDLQATERLAKMIAMEAETGDVICLKGELGVGKTAFTRAFVSSFFAEGIEVPSPTFGLVQAFSAPEFSILHYDLYRIKHQNELAELGLEEAFSSGVTLIEWPEIIRPLLPENFIELNLAYGKTEESRVASLSAHGSWQQRLGPVEKYYHA